ncbi:MAG: c-type cytochrome [Burkholderiales bacterium]|nr:c-type cytochrome [Burkholderiales bacterium]
MRGKRLACAECAPRDSSHRPGAIHHPVRHPVAIRHPGASRDPAGIEKRLCLPALRSTWIGAALRALSAGALLLLSAAAAAGQNEDLYREHCAACHGADRLGGMGPALLPENLGRLSRSATREVIANGRHATQMPGFAGTLTPSRIESLTQFVHSALARVPDWGAAQIEQSRVVMPGADRLPARPAYAADPLNLFVVVEAGDQHVTILDGDRFEPLTRFPSRFALHGGPKFSPDGRFVYFASRDGWISKYDLWNLQLVAEVRAGINTRNAAVSADGRYVAVGNYLPHDLVILDARDLSLVRIIETRDKAGNSSRVSAVYDAAPRSSFVVALKDVPELWEISYDPAAEPVYEGMVHDYRLGEGIAAPGQFTPRRTQLDGILDDFFFDPTYAYVIGAGRDGAAGQVINLDVRRRVAHLPLPGLPHLGSGITWDYQGRTVLATPNLKSAVVSVIDMKTWQPLRQIETAGPGFFMRSHENSRYAWVDAFNSPRKDSLQVIDKATLEVVRTITPAPGRTAAHVEFTRDGRFALVSVWEMDGALVVYDAATLEEVRRIPMRKPVGKYNVHNKITRSSGTSH